MQEALRRYKEEVAADPDTSSGFFTNTNAANDTKQYVLVRHQLLSFPSQVPSSGRLRTFTCAALPQIDWVHHTCHDIAEAAADGCPVRPALARGHKLLSWTLGGPPLLAGH